ncbi:MAG: MerR family transcriptional regulator [Clostridia bacterium]|nr:MerR family transcriptional regulator [Oscillospiraceae bacterium]MBQ6513942.1 MerR family transcriptional regulator [Clostridia bacterium]
MITIQGFAKLCGCNTQTLRYYDRIGLLTPAKVDEWTGYRYYEEEQALLFVKIKNLQQADFSIEEIKALLPGDDDLLAAAFERKIEEQQQKLERIREIQRSYLKETMDMQKLVSTIIGFMEEQLNSPTLWEEFGIDMGRKAEITAKAHAMLADMLAKNREALETVTLTMDDQAVTGAENVIRAIRDGNLDAADRILVNPDGTEEPNGIPEDAEVVFERHGWSHISEWIREMPLLKEAGERYCVFEQTAESAANTVGLPMMMLVMMASEMDELKGGVTCNTTPSKDGRNHFTLLFKKA